MGGTSSYSHGTPFRGNASTVGGSWGYNYDGLIGGQHNLLWG